MRQTINGGQGTIRTEKVIALSMLAESIGMLNDYQSELGYIHKVIIYQRRNTNMYTILKDKLTDFASRAMISICCILLLGIISVVITGQCFIDVYASIKRRVK